VPVGMEQLIPTRHGTGVRKPRRGSSYSNVDVGHVIDLVKHPAVIRSSGSTVIKSPYLKNK